MTDARTAPAAERNLAPILDLLAQEAPKMGAALEIASGTGQQIVAFANSHPGLTWQASDRDSGNLASIAAWGATARHPNLAPAIALDASLRGWSKSHADKALIVMVNLLHLIPQDAALVVLTEAAAALCPGGKVMIYGPFLRKGRTTSDGDAAFHASLQAQDPAIGYKEADWLQAQMAKAGLDVRVVNMPANNLCFIGTASPLS